VKVEVLVRDIHTQQRVFHLTAIYAYDIVYNYNSVIIDWETPVPVKEATSGVGLKSELTNLSPVSCIRQADVFCAVRAHNL
jgi:hypothetical protein